MRVVSQSKDVSLDFDRAVFTANHGMITAMVDGKNVYHWDVCEFR